MRTRKSVSDGVLPPGYVGGRDPKGVTCSGKEKTTKQTPERPIGAETFRDGGSQATVVAQVLDPKSGPRVVPNVVDQDDGIKFLERNGCWELGRKPATSKPKAIQVSAITNGPGGIGGYLKVRRFIGKMVAGGGRVEDGAEAPRETKDLGTECCEDEGALDAGDPEGNWCKAPDGKQERAKTNEAREKTVDWKE
ncbi:hypothetical protein ACROYT_G017314 [Oculina patagonica]